MSELMNESPVKTCEKVFDLLRAVSQSSKIMDS